MIKNEIDYEITQIIYYKIVCKICQILSFYVGKTTNFNQRESEHKSNCNNSNRKNYNYKIYKTIRENGGWENWEMIKIEKRFVKDKQESLKIEQDYINKLNPDMNTYNAFRNKLEYDRLYSKQYYFNNKEKIKEYYKQYKKLKKLEKASQTVFKSEVLFELLSNINLIE